MTRTLSQCQSPHLQEAGLLVEREGVEAHGADECDPGGEDVEHVLVLAHPQTLQLGERGEGAEVLQVQHLHVGQPQLQSRANGMFFKALP